MQPRRSEMYVATIIDLTSSVRSEMWVNLIRMIVARDSF